MAYVLNALYRKVYKARCRESGKMYALKKIRMETEKEGVGRRFINHLITTSCSFQLRQPERSNYLKA